MSDIRRDSKRALGAFCAFLGWCLLAVALVVVSRQAREIEELRYDLTDAQTRAITAEKAVWK